MKKKVKHQHSEFSPSSLYRIEACPGSHALTKGLPRTDSKWSLEGTDAHKCLEMFTKNMGKNPFKIREFLYDKYPATMVNHAFTAYMDLSAEIKNESDIFHAETKVDISHCTRPGEKGTADAAVVELFGRLLVADFKYGAGVVVDPEENLQGIAYALGFLKMYDYNFSHVEVMIIQPRAFHHRGPKRSWTFQIEEAEKYENRIRNIVQKALKKGAARMPGNHCQFCPAKDICTEFEDKNVGYIRAGRFRNYKNPFKNEET